MAELTRVTGPAGTVLSGVWFGNDVSPPANRASVNSLVTTTGAVAMRSTAASFPFWATSRPVSVGRSDGSGATIVVVLTVSVERGIVRVTTAGKAIWLPPASNLLTARQYAPGATSMVVPDRGIGVLVVVCGNPLHDVVPGSRSNTAPSTGVPPTSRVTADTDSSDVRSSNRYGAARTVSAAAPSSKTPGGSVSPGSSSLSAIAGASGISTGVSTYWGCSGINS